MMDLRAYLTVIAFGALAAQAWAQADGLVVYVPNRPVERTADDSRITFAESAVAGRMEAIIPEDADRVDILNGRGNVKHTYESSELDQIGLSELRPGTWTLRVHRRGSLSVRRFVVMEQG